jgi:DNA-binding NtrC family response regulator
MHPLFRGPDLRAARDLSTVAFASPFGSEAEAAHKRLLGPAWAEGPGASAANRASLLDRTGQVVAAAKGHLQSGLRPSDEHKTLYEDAVLLLLYLRSERRLTSLLDTEPGPDARPPALPWFPKFASEAEELLGPAGGSLLALHPPQHQLASFHQIARALRAIEGLIVGASPSTARLRNAIWQSVFTVDLRRYRRTAYRTLDDVPTLITGPSGSGKELVARAIGYSRYVPFDVGARRFTVDPRSAFHALNLSALSPTLIESELFGHRRGAFTGAQEDRIGWLESCPAGGAVFLDEIGEISADIQVKLLRVIESRAFQRLGETKPRQFVGKIVAATNRDLGHEMRAGRFREDLYYRLCADMLTTAPLTESIRDAPGERRALIHHVATRLVGASEADELTRQVESVVQDKLGDDYGWPGNFRELEQCVRNVLIHGNYEPAAGRSSEADPDDLARGMRAASFTADELMRRYVRIVYDRTGNLVETARRLDLDRRTARAKLGMVEAKDAPR